MAEKSYSALGGGDAGGCKTDTRISSAGDAEVAANAAGGKRKWRFRRPSWKWAILLGAAVIRGTLFGVLNNYTVLAVKLKEVFGTNEEIVGWIGSLVLSIYTFSSPLSVTLSVKFGHRNTILLGFLICATSLMVSSFVKEVYLFFLTFSLLFGVGMSLTNFCAYDYLMSYFHKEFVRGSALMALSVSVGIIVLAPLVEYLLDSLGLQNTLRVISGFILLMSVSAFIFRPSPAEKRRMSVVMLPVATTVRDDNEEEQPAADRSADKLALRTKTTTTTYKPPVHSKKTFSEAKEVYSALLRCPRMWIINGVSITLCLASTFSYLYMVAFLNSLGFSVKTSAFTLSMMGVGQFGGTILSSLLGDRIPLYRMELLAIVTFLAAIATAALTVVTDYTGVLSLVIAFGVCRSIYNLMLYPVVIESMGKERKMESISIASVMCGVGFLPGGVIGGALYDATGSYVPSLTACASTYLVTCVLLLWLSYCHRKATAAPAAGAQGLGRSGEGEAGVADSKEVVESIMTTV